MKLSYNFHDVLPKQYINIYIYIYREMLTSALRALVKDPVKESFYGKRKKKLMF